MPTKTLERPLTETDYRTRRLAIERDLAEARDKSQKAQLKLVQGDLSDEEADAQASAVTKLEQRLAGIDQAWNESERIFGEASNAARVKERRAAVSAVRKLEADRLEIIRKINDALAALEPLADAVLETESLMMAALDPFRRELDNEELRDLTRAIRSHTREGDVLRCTLSRSGLQKLSVVPGVPLADYGFDSISAWRQPIQRYLDRLDELE